jgi:hypothetical protein
VWYYAAGPMASPTSFTAPMYAFANGQAIGAPYRAPTAPVRVGTLTLEFFAPDEAELTLADSAAVTVKRRPRRGPQTPVLPTPRISLPPNWNGSFTWELEIHRTEAGGFTVHEVTTVVLNGDFFDPLPSPPTPARTRTYDFVGTMDVTYRHQGLIPSLGSCSHSFSGSEAVPSSVTLLVRDDGSYELKAAVSMDLTARGICAVLGRSSPSTKEFPVHFNKARRGNVVSSRIFGHPRDEPSGAGTERMNWHFLATL